MPIKHLLILIILFFVFFFTGCSLNSENQDDFTSEVSCMEACRRSSYEQGLCKWAEEDQFSGTNLGTCFIQDSFVCNTHNECNCFCYNPITQQQAQALPSKNSNSTQPEETQEPTTKINQPEEKEAVAELLNNLKNQTKIDFSNLEELEFQWNQGAPDENNTQALKGKGFQAEKISFNQYLALQNFFTQQAFQLDPYNSLTNEDNTIESIGYTDQKIYCLMQSNNIIEETRDFEIKCADANNVLGRAISDEEEIKVLLANQFNTKINNVDLKIIQSTENHIRGTVKILNDNQEASTISTDFLAIKAEDNWQLVFYGDKAMTCEELMQYNFPEIMLPECKL